MTLLVKRGLGEVETPGSMWKFEDEGKEGGR